MYEVESRSTQAYRLHQKAKSKQCDSYALWCEPADRGKLRDIVSQHFSGNAIDLVIDDASHIYTPSLATFETLSPLIRPGGLYILEDWRASLLARQRQKGAATEPRLDSLVHEVLEFSTINPNIIPSITSNKNFIVIERGEGALPQRLRLATDNAR